MVQIKTAGMEALIKRTYRTVLQSPVVRLAGLWTNLRSALQRGPTPAGPGRHAGLTISHLLAPPPERQAAAPPRSAREHELRLAYRRLLELIVVPALQTRRQQQPWDWPAFGSQASVLARLLTAASPRAATELVNEVFAAVGSLARLLTGLVEPAARKLGDRWREDDCSEFDVTLGLFRLQSAVRQLDIGREQAAGQSPCNALLVPEPGEMHMLGAALHADLAWQSGWNAQIAFPASDAELQALVAGRWFDLLDLSLSAAFQREHWLSRLATTVVQARRASLNPALVVSVSGRLFEEDPHAGQAVGADCCCRSAAHFAGLLMQTASDVAASAAPQGRAAPSVRPASAARQ